MAVHEALFAPEHQQGTADSRCLVGPVVFQIDGGGCPVPVIGLNDVEAAMEIVLRTLDLRRRT